MNPKCTSFLLKLDFFYVRSVFIFTSLLWIDWLSQLPGKGDNGTKSLLDFFWEYKEGEYLLTLWGIYQLEWIQGHSSLAITHIDAQDCSVLYSQCPLLPMCMQDGFIGTSIGQCWEIKKGSTIFPLLPRCIFDARHDTNMTTVGSHAKKE